MSSVSDKVKNFWQRQFGRKPWVFRDRYGLGYLMDGKAGKPKCFATGLAQPNAALLTYLEQTIQPGMTIVDLSPGIGAVTLLAGKLLGNNGHVYAFAPEPAAYRVLVNNVALSALTARVAVIGREVLAPAPPPDALTLDAVAAAWQWPPVALLRLDDMARLPQLLRSAAQLFQRGAIERVVLDQARLNDSEAIRPLIAAGYRLHVLTPEAGLQVFDFATIHDAAPVTVVALRTSVPAR